MKKIIMMLLCVAMAFSAIACESGAAKNGTDASNKDMAQIPNPFINCETIEQGEKLAGFEITVPENMPEGFAINSVRVIENTFIDITYTNGDNEICIRKAKGDEDISGDFTEYEENNTIQMNDVSVILRGNNGKINDAVWSIGDYSYAIGANIGKEGIDKDIISDMIKNIK